MNFNLKKMNYKHLVIPVLLSLSFLSCKKTKEKAKVEDNQQQVQGDYRLESLKILGITLPKSLPPIPTDLLDDSGKKSIVYLVNQLRDCFDDLINPLPEAGNTIIHQGLNLTQAYYDIQNGGKSKIENLVRLAEKIEVKEQFLAIKTWKYNEEDEKMYYTSNSMVKELDHDFFLRVYKMLAVLMAKGNLFEANIADPNADNLIGLVTLAIAYLQNSADTSTNLPLEMSATGFDKILENAVGLGNIFSIDMLPGLLSGLLGVREDLLMIFFNQNFSRADVQLSLNEILNLALGEINSLEFRFPDATKMGIWGMGGSELLPFDINWKSSTHLYGRTELPLELSPVEAAIYIEMKKIAQEGDHLIFKLHDITGGLKAIEYILALLAGTENQKIGSEKVKNLAKALKGRMNNKTIMTERPGVLAAQMLYELSGLNYLLSFINENLVTFNLIKN